MQLFQKEEETFLMYFFLFFHSRWRSITFLIHEFSFKFSPYFVSSLDSTKLFFFLATIYAFLSSRL